MTEIDKAIVIVGLPKHGKTTRARDLAMEFLHEHPTGLALVHDRHEQFAPDICAVYATTDAWRAAAAAAAADKKPFPRGASFRCAASDVTRLAVELGERHNRAKHVKVPMLVVYDESSLMDTSGPTHMDSIDVELFSNRRHYGVAPVYNVQRPGALMEAFYSQSTDVFIFSQPSQDWARTLEQKLGLAKDALASLVGGPKFKYAHWKQGEGLVR